MNKKYLTLKELQEQETKILEKTIKFLNENNIKYYIAYGTLLGAVRHQGFIPWDNDIDLMMFRSEYDKLIEILKKNNNKINEELEGIAFELGNSDWPFLKIINKNILVDEKEGCDKNLWIDIFPLENSKQNKKVYSFKRKIIDKLQNYKRYDVYNWSIKGKNIIKILISKFIILLLKFVKYETIVDKYIKWSKNNLGNECEYVVNNVWDSSNNAYKKSWFKDKKLKFENLEVNGIEKYDELLTLMYGDYMKLPDEKDRISHEIKAYRRDHEEK